MAAIAADNHGLRLGVRYLVLILIAIIFVFPLVFMVMSSLKPDQQLLTDRRGRPGPQVVRSPSRHA